MIELKVYSKREVENSIVFNRVMKVASDFLGEMNKPLLLTAIDTATPKENPLTVGVAGCHNARTGRTLADLQQPRVRFKR